MSHIQKEGSHAIFYQQNILKKQKQNLCDSHAKSDGILAETFIHSQSNKKSKLRNLCSKCRIPLNRF